MKIHLIFESICEKKLDRDYYCLEEMSDETFFIDIEVPCVPRKDDEIVLTKDDVIKMKRSLKNLFARSSYNITLLSNKILGNKINSKNADKSIEDIARSIHASFITVTKNVFISGHDAPIILCNISLI